MENSYYAVIFTSARTSDDKGYAEMADKMEKLAAQQTGFLGLESARSEIGITVSYWESLEAIAQWKANADHLVAQHKGKTDWYKWYKVRICLVERAYESSQGGAPHLPLLRGERKTLVFQGCPARKLRNNSTEAEVRLWQKNQAKTVLRLRLPSSKTD